MDRFDGCGEAGTICYNFGGWYYLLKSRKSIVLAQEIYRNFYILPVSYHAPQ